jgi:hypothetical protein
MVQEVQCSKNLPVEASMESVSRTVLSKGTEIHDLLSPARLKRWISSY